MDTERHYATTTMMMMMIVMMNYRHGNRTTFCMFVEGVQLVVRVQFQFGLKQFFTASVRFRFHRSRTSGRVLVNVERNEIDTRMNSTNFVTREMTIRVIQIMYKIEKYGGSHSANILLAVVFVVYGQTLGIDLQIYIPRLTN